MGDIAAQRASALTRLCTAWRERPYEFDAARPTTRQRFERFYAASEGLLRAAIDAWIAVDRALVRPTGELAELSRVVLEDDARVLDELWGGLDDGLSYIGFDEGYFYGGQPWSELCVVRSGIELLAALAGHHDPEMGRDAIALMDHYAYEMYQPQTPPDGMPLAHWWWRSPVPPNGPP